MDGFESEFFYPSLTKEEKETLLAKKIEDIRRKNKELERRHAEIEADKRLAVGSRASVQLPAASRRAPGNDDGENMAAAAAAREGEAAATAASAAAGATAENARRLERFPPQSNVSRRERQGAASPTAAMHGRSGRAAARRGRAPQNKVKVNRGGADGRCSSRDSSLLKFPLKKPGGLGWRRFSRESLTAGWRRAWPPKKNARRTPVLASSASGAEPAAAGDVAANDGRRLTAKPGPTSWRAQHRRGGSGDATAAVAAARTGAVLATVQNGVLAPVAVDGSSTQVRRGSGGGPIEAAVEGEAGVAIGSRECGAKKGGGCPDRARGLAGRYQRQNNEEKKKRKSAIYEDGQPMQQQKQQPRPPGQGTVDGVSAKRSPPPVQPTRLDLEMRLTGRERRAYSAWKEERDRVDEERLGRARDAGGGWRREWDADKAEPPTPPPPSSASTGSASTASAGVGAAPQWPTSASSATSSGTTVARSVLSAAAPAWPYTQPAPAENALPPLPQQPLQQQWPQRQQCEPLLPDESSGWLATSKTLAAQPLASGCQRRAVGSGRFTSQGDRRKSGPASGTADDTGDPSARRESTWPDGERVPPARRAPVPPQLATAGSRGGRSRGGAVGTRGRRWPTRGGWRMQRSAYGGSTSSLHRPSSRASVVEDIVIIHVEDDDDGGASLAADIASGCDGRLAVKTEGAGAAGAVAAVAAALSPIVADGRSGRAGEVRKYYPEERFNGRRRRGGGGRGGRPHVAAADTASRDDARAATASRPREDAVGRTRQSKDDEWEDVADAESGAR